MSKKYNFKIVMLGEGGVGKTSILYRYCRNEFDHHQKSTIQLSYFEKSVFVGRDSIKLGLYDSAGQERFHSLAPIYYRDADGVVLVFSITDHSSFDKIKKWKKELTRFCEKEVEIVLAANKSDLQHSMVSEEEMRNFGVPYFKTSAKVDSNVKELFTELTKNILKKRKMAVGGPAGKILNERLRPQRVGSVRIAQGVSGYNQPVNQEEGCKC